MARKVIKKKKAKKIIIKSLGIFLAICIFGFVFLLYGPYKGFSDWLITNAMTSMNHQYYATWLYSDKYIEKVMSRNTVNEIDEKTNPNEITFEIDSNSYKNDYEKQILKHSANQKYKLIKIKEGSLRGYLVAIYDASKVTLETSKSLGSYGQYLTTMSKEKKPLVAINASGFADEGGHGTGGTPNGYIISHGKLVWDGELYKNLVGFDKNNVLVIGKYTAEEALEIGIRDAVNFGPALIINGKSSGIQGNGGWGQANRTAIGQRKDGIVLFLVMDGRDYAAGVPGASMKDLVKLMERYGAYNACNLDGGTSSNLVINNKLVNKVMNGSFENRTRPIATSFMLFE